MKNKVCAYVCMLYACLYVSTALNMFGVNEPPALELEAWVCASFRTPLDTQTTEVPGDRLSAQTCRPPGGSPCCGRGCTPRLRLFGSLKGSHPPSRVGLSQLGQTRFIPTPGSETLPSAPNPRAPFALLGTRHLVFREASETWKLLEPFYKALN